MWSDITAETKALALAPARHIWCRAIVGSKSGGTWVSDRNYYETDYIVSAAVDIGARSGGIQIGGAYCAKLVLRLLDGADIRQTDRIIMRVGFYKPDGSKTEHISLGWFYVDTIKKANGIITVTAYDKMLRAQKNYRSALEYPAKISAVLEEICGKLGVNLAPDFVIPEDGNISLKPVKGTDADGNELYYTMRQVLSFLASAMGGNLFFDAGGHLQLTKFVKVSDVFAAANSIEADISADAYSVAGIVWTIGGVTYSRNDENTAGIMEFENPLTFYPKETVQHAIEERVTGLSYHDGTISRQGCGWFELGDIVTAYRADGSFADVLITGISYEIKDGGFTEKIYSSARSESQDNFTTGDIPGATEPQSVSGAPQASTAGAISSYEYLSDPSVKINSVTYTVEKNAAGLITKISDSNGGELEPKISGNITEITLHNAALLGAVLARGIGQPNYFMPVMTGVQGYFDVTRGAGASSWINQIDGIPMAFRGGSASVNSSEIVLPDGVYAIYELPTNNNGSFTVYAVLRSDYDSIRNRHDVLLGSVLGNYKDGWRCVNSDGYSSGDSFRSFMVDTFAGGMSVDNDGDPVSTYDKFHIIALRQTNTGGASAQLEAFIDGVKSSGSLTVPAAYNSSWGLNCCAQNGARWQASNTTIYVKFWALGNSAHSDNDIIRNQHFLMEKFL